MLHNWKWNWVVKMCRCQYWGGFCDVRKAQSTHCRYSSYNTKREMHLLVQQQERCHKNRRLHWMRQWKWLILTKFIFKFTYLNALCEEMCSAQLLPFSSTLAVSRLFEMRHELRIFFSDNSFQESKCFTDISWLAVVAYLSDIFTYLNGLNLSVQGQL
jgi:hypothetical protein